VLEPGAIEAAVAAARAAAAGRDEHLRAVELELEQARYHAERSFRQYDVSDSESQLVTVELERRWNETLARVSALDELHGQEVDAFRLFDRVDGHDAGVVEGGERFCLTPESLEPLRARGHPGGQHLEGHVAPELRVGGAVDLTPPARADRGGNAVVRQLLADQRAIPLR